MASRSNFPNFGAALIPFASVARTPKIDSITVLHHAPLLEQVQSVMYGKSGGALRAPPSSGSTTGSAKGAWPNGPWLALFDTPLSQSNARSTSPIRYSPVTASGG